MADTIRHPPKAVFFDLDGTLVDSRAGVVHAVGEGIRRCFNAHGIGSSPPDASRIIAGLGQPASLYFRSLLPAEFAHLAAEAQAHSTEFEVRALAGGHGRLFEGTLEALDALGDSKISVGLVSNAQKGYFEAALAHLELAPRVDFALCHDDLPKAERSAGKSALLRRGLEALQVEAAEALMVGDRADDFAAARAHGCRSCAVRCGFGGEEELAAADLRFDDVAALVRSLLDQPTGG